MIGIGFLLLKAPCSSNCWVHAFCTLPLPHPGEPSPCTQQSNQCHPMKVSGQSHAVQTPTPYAANNHHASMECGTVEKETLNCPTLHMHINVLERFAVEGALSLMPSTSSLCLGFQIRVY